MTDTNALVERAKTKLRGEMRLRREDCYALLDCIRAQAKALAEAEEERDRLRAIHGAKSTIEECFDRTSYTTLSAAIKGWKERAAAAEAERDAVKALLDKHEIAMPGGTTNWSLVDRAGIACAAATDQEDRTRAEVAEAKLTRYERVVEAARGLSFGTDWNNGTHAKLHGCRQKLLDALADLAREEAENE